jgi:hypothetical protein
MNASFCSPIFYGASFVQQPLQCVCEKGYYGDACESTEMEFGLTYYSNASGAPKWMIGSLMILVLVFSMLLVRNLRNFRRRGVVDLDSLSQILINLERMKVLASGLFYYVSSSWEEYRTGDKSSRDGLGNYSKVSANDRSRAISSELASKGTGEKYYGVLKPGSGNH